MRGLILHLVGILEHFGKIPMNEITKKIEKITVQFKRKYFKKSI